MRLSSKLLKQGYLVERLESSFRNFYCQYSDLIHQYQSSSQECKMKVWPLTSYHDFPTDQTFHQFHNLDTEFDLHRITSGFHRTFATGVACQQGTRTLPDTWFRPLWLKLFRPLLRLAVSFLDFSPWIPFVTFSILHCTVALILGILNKDGMHSTYNLPFLLLP